MPNVEIDLQEFLQSIVYQSSLTDICKAMNQALDENVPKMLLDDDIDQLRAANLPISSLQSVLQESMKAFKKFSVQKFNALQHENSDGDFANDEPQPKDEKSVIEVMHPMFTNFLVSYLIEYILAVQHPDRLEPYLQCMRYPFAKKYAEQLKGWATH